MKYILPIFSLLLIGLTSCGNMPEYGSLDAPSFRITEDSVTIVVGQTVTLSLSVGISNVTWTSEFDTVATVDYRGRVTAIAEGQTIITAERTPLPTDYNSTPSEPSSCLVTVLPADTQEE